MAVTVDAMPKRGSILLEAHKIINGERQNTYGDPEDSFQLIASYWSIYLQLAEPLEPKDVTLMMALFKIARESHQGKLDNLIDAAGYLGIAGDMK